MINNIHGDLAQIKSQQHTQQSYTDLHSLQNIRKLGSDDKEGALRQVAQQFESMFIQMMLKSMRSANEVFGQDNPLNTSETKHHQEMYDSQLSLTLGESNNIGLADAFYRQMKNNYLSSSNTDESTTASSPNANELTKLSPSSEAPSSEAPSSEAIQPFFGNGSQSSHGNFSNSQTSSQRITDAKVLKDIQSPEDFIAKMTPYAKQAAEALGVDHRVLVAQSALETGWGEHVIRDQHGNQSFNLFNIKADSRWQGKSVSVPTIEYVGGVAQRENASFRRYASIDDSFTDYQQFLSQPRYEKALAVTSDANLFVKELQNAGYATDPRYAEKIQSILENEKIW
ncbi:MAG: flagellar protein FlgJ [Candidatus Endobugula sp.]|jgi:flagellar protein FlgJ